MITGLNKLKMAATLVAAVFFINACGQVKTNSNNKAMEKETSVNESNIDTATFGAGCFWCVEAVFQRMNGVLTVKSGYSGGTVKNPSYKEVCQGTTGHAEVCQLTYDKTKVSFDELLEVFWKTHDPTTLNSQGNDHGTQYRSAIFYHNDAQKKTAEKYKEEINKSGAYPNPVVTEITAFTKFYPAENYHDNYFNQNSSEPYCKFVIQPKVDKFEKIFKNKMKH
ncbi:MAG: peptide methionine sulfoxide reductase MsrA [Bacteroidetes bacterium]|nr:peptide methionine sulfoxide reductase MsrA [Bacteroidota bacterium]